MRESSTCGFVFADYVMLGGCRPSPVNRHGFGIVGRAGARLAPTMGPAPAGWPLGGWRPAPRKRKTAGGGTRDVPRAPERWPAASPPPAGRAPRADKGIAGLRRPFPRLQPRPDRAPRAGAGESFSKIVLASASEFPYSTSSHGGVAQLGERLTGSQEVRGSIPLVSTIVNVRPLNRVAFFCKIFLSAAVVAFFATTESSSLNSVDLALRDVIVNLVP